MSYSPGTFPQSALVQVEANGSQLAIRQARAYRRLKADLQNHGHSFRTVGKYAAYRSNPVQHGMHLAGLHGPQSERIKYQLNPNSSVAIADAPNGTHQDGKAFDYIIDGSSAYQNADIRAIFHKHGWFWTFGSNDPNHVHHDDIHSVVAVSRAWCIQNHLFVQPAK